MISNEIPPEKSAQPKTYPFNQIFHRIVIGARTIKTEPILHRCNEMHKAGYNMTRTGWYSIVLKIRTQTCKATSI